MASVTGSSGVSTPGSNSFSAKKPPSLLDEWRASLQSLKHLHSEVLFEFTPSSSRPISAYAAEAIAFGKSFIHVPYFPFLHRPGWLLRYALGPFDANYVESLVYDFAAGITVSLLLIPQVSLGTLHAAVQRYERRQFSCPFSPLLLFYFLAQVINRHSFRLHKILVLFHHNPRRPCPTQRSRTFPQ